MLSIKCEQTFDINLVVMHYLPKHGDKDERTFSNIITVEVSLAVNTSISHKLCHLKNYTSISFHKKLGLCLAHNKINVIKLIFNTK